MTTLMNNMVNLYRTMFLVHTTRGGAALSYAVRLYYLLLRAYTVGSECYTIYGRSVAATIYNVSFLYALS